MVWRIMWIIIYHTHTLNSPIARHRFVIMFFFRDPIFIWTNRTTLIYSSSPILSNWITLYESIAEVLKKGWTKSTLIYVLLHRVTAWLFKLFTADQIRRNRKWLSEISIRFYIISTGYLVYPMIQCSVLLTKSILPISSKQIYTSHYTEIIYNCCNPLSLRKSIVHRNINQYIRTKNRIPFRHVMQHIDTLNTCNIKMRGWIQFLVWMYEWPTIFVLIFF